MNALLNHRFGADVLELGYNRSLDLKVRRPSRWSAHRSDRVWTYPITSLQNVMETDLPSERTLRPAPYRVNFNVAVFVLVREKEAQNHEDYANDNPTVPLLPNV